MKKMTEREQQVYQLIAKNPYISQQTLSETLDLSRSTVANLISSLVQKDILLGRAYVLNHSKQIVCVGGANVDRKFYSKKPVQLHTSNPVHSSYSAGGVARNIAENLGRLGFLPSLITAAGKDADWGIIEQASFQTMNLEGVLQLPHAATGTYTAVLDEDGELMVALADMDVFEAIRPELVMKSEVKLRQAECIVADLNCPKETLELLLRKARSYDVPLAFVTVSAPKMDRLPADLRGLSWMMTNIEESEAFFQCKVKSQEDWRQIVRKWLDTGIEQVTVTSGDKGVMAGHREHGITHFSSSVIENVVDVTGAGDAFSAGVLYGWLEGMTLEQTIQIGMTNAAINIQSSSTVKKDLTSDLLLKDMEDHS